jgi:hypothetical protein
MRQVFAENSRKTGAMLQVYRTRGQRASAANRVVDRFSSVFDVPPDALDGFAGR